MTDPALDALWGRVLEQVASRAAHEIKDSLNGVSLNLEVIRSRSARDDADVAGISPFAVAAAEQMEVLGVRTEALLYISRPPREPADVALSLRHLAALLVPATKADGGTLAVEGYDRSAPTSASSQATRLALAAALLMITEGGGASRCTLETGAETVVRFSHESAAGSLKRAIAAAIATHDIRTERSDHGLMLVFPGTSPSHGATN